MHCACGRVWSEHSLHLRSGYAGTRVEEIRRCVARSLSWRPARCSAAPSAGRPRASAGSAASTACEVLYNHVPAERAAIGACSGLRLKDLASAVQAALDDTAADYGDSESLPIKFRQSVRLLRQLDAVSHT